MANQGTAAASRPQADRFPGLLWAMALSSRLLWVLWVHPPAAHRYSDMLHYWWRAEDIAARAPWTQADSVLAWQSPGTQMLLSIPIRIFGPDLGATVAGLGWGVASACIVMGVYALAQRLGFGLGLGKGWARACGLGALLWFPHLSLAGFFLSEVPFTAALLWATVDLVASIRTNMVAGKGANGGGDGFGFVPRYGRMAICLVLAIILRPQALVFVALLGLVMAVVPRLRARVERRGAIIFASTAALAFGFLLAHHAHQVGHVGVAENAALNYAAGRCHNIVTTGPASPDERGHYRAHGLPIEQRRVSLPAFRALSERLGPGHPLALRPVQGETLALKTPLRESAPLYERARACTKATGLLGQVRHGVVHLSLLWVHAHPWPERSDGEENRVLFVLAEVFRALAAWVVLPLALLGAVAMRREPRIWPLLAQLAAALAVAAVFFGSPRLRVPLDPILLVLAVAGIRHGWRRILAFRAT